VKGELGAYQISGSEGLFEGFGRKHDRRRVEILLWCHLDDLPVEQFDSLVAEEAEIAHLIIFIQ
jgi:hypothetical protein